MQTIIYFGKTHKSYDGIIESRESRSCTSIHTPLVHIDEDRGYSPQSSSEQSEPAGAGAAGAAEPQAAATGLGMTGASGPFGACSAGQICRSLRSDRGTVDSSACSSWIGPRNVFNQLDLYSGVGILPTTHGPEPKNARSNMPGGV